MGGFVGALIVIPIVLSCGTVSYQSIGHQYAAAGIAAAFVSAIVCAVIAGLFGGSILHVNSPKTSHAAILSGLIAVIATHHSFTDIYPPDRAPAALMTICFLTILVSGGVQLALGTARLGSVVKFLPYPVLAGFINGFALQIMIGQAHVVFGLDTNAQLRDWLFGHGRILPGALALAAFSAALMLATERWVKIVPSALIGLIGGTSAFLIASRSTDAATFGPLIGELPQGIALAPRFGDIIEFVQSLTFSRHVFPILATGVTLAMVSSIQSLLSVAASERLLGSRHDGNRELMVQGAGNILAALFGGAPSGGSPNVTQTVFANGGRTRIANLTHAVALIALAAGLSQVIAKIPMSVMAAVVITSTASSMDKWTHQLIRGVGSSSAVSRRDYAVDLGIVVLVTALLLSAGALAALGAGMAVTFLIFLSRTNAKMVRRVLRGDSMRSRTSRTRVGTEVLDQHGHRIVVIELEGPMFFGSVEAVSKRLDAEAASADWIVLDCKRVADIDTSGAMAIKRSDEILRKQHKRLFLSYLPQGGKRRAFLNSMGVGRLESEGRIFPDTDSALAQAEDELLRRHGCRVAAEEGISLAPFDAFAGLSELDLAWFSQNLTRRTFSADEVIVRHGDRERSALLLVSGRVAVRTEVHGRDLRLFSYSAGMIFGEMALLTEDPSSVSVIAETHVVAFELSARSFDILLSDRPALAAIILRNLACNLVRRVRLKDTMICQLET
jgi:sulfate permease, SulP family